MKKQKRHSFFLFACFLISINTTVALDPSGSVEDIISKWVKKNPIADHEFSNLIKAEKVRNLLGDSPFGGYHRAVVNHEEIWAIAVSEIEVISITTKPLTQIHFKILYKGTWREFITSEHEYNKLLSECKKLDV